MKADLSRDTFEPARHFLRVLQQQGRVQLDADWNEQAAILIHYLQTLAGDLIGPFGGPRDHVGFEVTFSDGDLFIGAGRYYVDGLLCENEALPPTSIRQDKPVRRGKAAKAPSPPSVLSYFDQPDWPRDRKADSLPERESFLVYLDVWERHLTYIDDDRIREVALGGPDTASRSKIVWQVKVATTMPDGSPIGDVTRDDIISDWEVWVAGFRPTDRGKLAARTSPSGDYYDPCITPPSAGYRGGENQLYRVEIRTPGELGTATYVWSRENGSVVSGWDQSANQLTLADPGRDRKLGFAAAQWIELTDDAHDLASEPGTLVRLLKVDGPTLSVEEDTATGPLDPGSFSLRPRIRRWDSEGELPVEVPTTNDGWIELEDGVEVRFAPSGVYRTGDYWLIPARTLGGVEWPVKDGEFEPLRPHGIDHHFAPLALFTVADNGFNATDCRCIFDRLACPPLPT